MKRNWFIAAILIGVVAIVVAAIAMRASDDSPETTEEWAGALCSSLSDWRESIAALADVSGDDLTADDLRTRLEAARGETAELVAELRELGPPPGVADGDEVEDALDDATAGLDESWEDVESAVEDATEADSAAELASAVAEIADDVSALLDQVPEVVASLQSASLFGEASAELEQAFAEAGSCQALSAEG